MEKDLCKDWAVNIKLKQENSKIQCYIAQKDPVNNNNGWTIHFQNLERGILNILTGKK